MRRRRIKKRKSQKNYQKYIENESKITNYGFFRKHFNFAVPSALVKQLYVTKNKNKNNGLVNVIKSGLSDLKDETNEMSKDEIKIEKPAKILKISEEILEFNEQDQSGEGLKILTPNQMLSRLPIIN